MIEINHKALTLPLHPGDEIFNVYYDSAREPGDEFVISKDRVTSVVISKDNTMQFIIDGIVEDFGPEDRNFRTRKEAEEYVQELKASYPRHIKMDYDKSREWFSPEFYLPEDSRMVHLTVEADEHTKSLGAFFVREKDSVLPEDFYLVSPEVYDEEYSVRIENLSPENTQCIPMEIITGWKDFPTSATWVSSYPPMDLYKKGEPPCAADTGWKNHRS